MNACRSENMFKLVYSGISSELSIYIFDILLTLAAYFALHRWEVMQLVLLLDPLTVHVCLWAGRAKTLCCRLHLLQDRYINHMTC